MRMSKKEKNLIITIANDLVDTQPFDGIELLEILSKTNPSDKTIKKPLKNQKEKIKNCNLLKYTKLQLNTLINSLKSNKTRIKNSAHKIKGKYINHSYILLMILTRKHPNDKEISDKIASSKSKIVAEISIKNMVVSARNDGLTARIEAIACSYKIAKHYNLDFKFTWLSNENILKNIHMSINKDIPNFICEKFISKYYIEEEELKNNSLPIIETETFNNVSGITIRKLSSKQKINEALKKHINLVSDCNLKYENNISTLNFSDFFSVFFSKDTINKYKAIKRLLNWSDYVAIHYRGGDVIYGSYRNGRHTRGKSLSIPVVEGIIESLNNQKIIIVGTPLGESLEDLLALKRKYKNIELSFDLINSHYIHSETSTLNDVFIMSMCKTIYSTKSTSVTGLARKIGNNKKITPTPSEELEYLKKSIKKIDKTYPYSPMQISFIFQNVFILEENQLRSEYNSQKNNINIIKSIDPKNKILPAFRFFLECKHNNTEQIKNILKERNSDYAHSLEHYRKRVPHLPWTTIPKQKD